MYVNCVNETVKELDLVDFIVRLPYLVGQINKRTSQLTLL